MQQLMNVPCLNEADAHAVITEISPHVIISKALLRGPVRSSSYVNVIAAFFQRRETKFQANISKIQSLGNLPCLRAVAFFDASVYEDLDCTTIAHEHFKHAVYIPLLLQGGLEFCTVQQTAEVTFVGNFFRSNRP